MAPGRNEHPGTYPYIVTRNIILAHAEGYHVLKKKYPQQNGMLIIWNFISSHWVQDIVMMLFLPIIFVLMVFHLVP